jgi:hypothetical protein
VKASAAYAGSFMMSDLHYPVPQENCTSVEFMATCSKVCAANHVLYAMFLQYCMFTSSDEKTPAYYRTNWRN